jgi:hypothetical protein
MAAGQHGQPCTGTHSGLDYRIGQLTAGVNRHGDIIRGQVNVFNPGGQIMDAVFQSPPPVNNDPGKPAGILCEPSLSAG